jgi:hypothetical protein
MALPTHPAITTVAPRARVRTLGQSQFKQSINDVSEKPACREPNLSWR